MKVKAVIEKEIEIEINDNDFIAWAESLGIVFPLSRENERKAIEAVEKAIGLPFGYKTGLPFGHKDETLTECIVGVYNATDGEPILQW